MFYIIHTYIYIYYDFYFHWIICYVILLLPAFYTVYSFYYDVNVKLTTLYIVTYIIMYHSIVVFFLERACLYVIFIASWPGLYIVVTIVWMDSSMWVKLI